MIPNFNMFDVLMEYYVICKTKI